MNYEQALAEIRARQQAHWPASVPTELSYPIEEQGIVDYLRHWAQERPDHEAIWFYGRSLSYRELADSAARFAGWLQTNGLQPGDRVGVYLANSPQFIVAMLGILWAGGVHVPVNPLLREHELQHELTDAGVTILLAQDDLLPLVQKVRERTPVRTIAVTSLGELVDAATEGQGAPFRLGPPSVEAPHASWSDVMAAAPAPARPTDPDALAALNYTGGTTGMPKGCEHTQRHMVYTAASATAAQGHRVAEYAEVSICFLPIFWIAGEDFGILIPIVNGGTVLLMARWDPALVLRLIESKRATTLIATVDNYVELMGLPDAADRELGSLETALAVSFVLHLTPEIRAQWRELTGHTLREASYGMTETHTADSITLGFQDEDWDLSAEPVFCGLPVPGTDFLIVDELGTPLGVDEVGEILVRSPSILRGYFNQPDATAAALTDGWLHTGDTGKLNARGGLHYLGRNKEMIKTSGMSVFPSEVESLLRLHPDVVTAAVVPMPDRQRGQVPLAFVQLAAGSTVTAEALREWAKENMATYKVPRIEIVSGLPMTATGKIRKGELFDKAGELAADSGPQ